MALKYTQQQTLLLECCEIHLVWEYNRRIIMVELYHIYKCILVRDVRNVRSCVISRLQWVIINHGDILKSQQW